MTHQYISIHCYKPEIHHCAASLLVPHEKVPGSNSGQGKQLVFFRVILIDYYKHYNKSKFDAPEIHDVALKV